jgi:putative intracellular protease/amidase
MQIAIVLYPGLTALHAIGPYEVVLVPGSGPRTATMMADTELTGWLRRVHETTRWTTSVCTGSLILAAARILDGQPATTHWNVQRGLAALGAKPQPGATGARGNGPTTVPG